MNNAPRTMIGLSSIASATPLNQAQRVALDGFRKEMAEQVIPAVERQIMDRQRHVEQVRSLALR
ncbi:MAG: hypothetical protein ACN6OP_19290 [Pseudomonadales bacterium]